MIRPLAIAIVLVAATLAPAFAYDTPRALIEALYAPFLADSVPEDELAFFSAETRAAWEALLAEDDYGLGFDPVVDGQDFALDDFGMGEPDPVTNGVKIVVTFTNFGEPRMLTYTLVEEDGGWLVEDIAAGDGEYPWRLSELLGQ